MGNNVLSIIDYSKTHDPLTGKRTHKQCFRCGEIKPYEDFRKYGGKLFTYCRICQNEKQREWRKDNPEKHKVIDRKHWLKRQFGLTPEEFNEKLIQQNNCCAICEGEFIGGPHKITINVDHNHSTGKIRGLLCSHCNRGLGHFRDDLNLFRAALKYLEDDNASTE